MRSHGLPAESEELALNALAPIGYYRLNAYWLFFEEPPAPGETRSHPFRPGSSFEQVIELYNRDRLIRLLVIDAIERIEIAVRSAGTLRAWIAATELELKTMVARSLGMPSAQVLNGVLHSLNLLHNISAHHGRIWNRLIVKRLPKIKKVPSFLVMGKVDGEGLQPSKPREWRMGEKAARVTHGAKVMAPSVD